MLVNLTELRDLIKGLLAEYDAGIAKGKNPSQIRVRIDCLLKKLDKCFGSVLFASSSDDVREI